MIVIDTSPLVAAAVANDRHHTACVDLFMSLRRDHQELVIPGPVPAEVGYMLHRLGGSKIESAFLRSLRDGVFKVVPPNARDWDQPHNHARHPTSSLVGQPHRTLGL